MKASQRRNLGRILLGFGLGILFTISYLLVGDFNTTKALPDGAVRPDTLVSFTEEFRLDANEYWSEEREYGACVRADIVLLPEEEDAQIQLVFGGFKDAVIGGEDRTQIPSCTEKAVIHSHPRVGCSNRLWSGDIPSAESWYSMGGVAYLVQCAPDRIEVYTRDSGTNGVVITI